MAPTHRWWEGIFRLNGHAFTVIGVTPPGFYGAKLSGGAMPDFWLPITAEYILAGSCVAAQASERKLS